MACSEWCVVCGGVLCAIVCVVCQSAFTKGSAKPRTLAKTDKNK